MASDGVLHAALLKRRIRASAAYQVVSFDALTPAQAKPLRFLRAGHPELDTLFLPTEPGLSVKVAPREAVDLVRRLGSGEVVGCRAERDSLLSCRDLAALVLDRVLEIETESGWRSGLGAVDVLLGDPPSPAADSSTARVSLAALEYGQRLAVGEPAVLADRLYRYNRRPVSPRLRRIFPDQAAVSSRLGLDPALHAPVTQAGALQGVAPHHSEHWLQWHRRNGSAGHGRNRAVHKLYVSPTLDGLRPALEETFSLFHGPGGPFAVKVGRSLPAVLRPDKLVAYFRAEEDLRRSAHRLEIRLGGLAAQPVPFTAQVGGDGLLSRGVDPPASRRLRGWRHGDASWRAWVTSRLGAAILVGRSEGPPAGEGEVVRFALARLAVEGIDPATWMPDPEVWSDVGGAT